MVCNIAGYVVEKCELGGDAGEFWERLPQTVAGQQQSVTVKDLTPGAKYKFRVRAENSLGQSEPQETDKPITAKNPYGQ